MTTRLLRAAGSSCEDIDWSSQAVRDAIEEDVAKARETRRRCCEQDLERGFGSTSSIQEALGDLTTVKAFSFDPAQHPLRATFLQCLGLDPLAPLEYLHALFGPAAAADAGKRHDRSAKTHLLSGLLNPRRRLVFHQAYDSFVRSVVLPLVAARLPSPPSLFYYQGFPSLRVVRPCEFSINLHADISYGFSQAAINVWLPLTACWGTNSLVLESSPGKEDWHALEGTYGRAFMFWGALCTHFTPANTTAQTRVSLDLRILTGSAWDPSHDRFQATPGYFQAAEWVGGEHAGWERVGGDELLVPDERVGFPFT